MSANSQRVLEGFKKLTSAEKKEVAKAIESFADNPYQPDQILDEAIDSIRKGDGLTLGPAPSTCVCCGR